MGVGVAKAHIGTISIPYNSCIPPKKAIFYLLNEKRHPHKKVSGLGLAVLFVSGRRSWSRRLLQRRTFDHSWAKRKS